jgi:hypothetical protein
MAWKNSHLVCEKEIMSEIFHFLALCHCFMLSRKGTRRKLKE